MADDVPQLKLLTIGDSGGRLFPKLFYSFNLDDCRCWKKLAASAMGRRSK